MSEINDSGQTRIKVDLNGFSTQRQTEFESFLRVPPNEISSVMLLSLLIADHKVGVTSNLTKKIKYFTGNLLSINLFFFSFFE